MSQRSGTISAALTRMLLADAAASGGMGVLLLVTAAPLAPLLGLPLPLLRGVALVLIPFAGLLIWTATRRAPRRVVWAIVAGNAAWIVASGALLVSGLVRPTRLGELFVVAQAAAVAVLTLLEWRAIRHESGVAAGNPARGKA